MRILVSGCDGATEAVVRRAAAAVGLTVAASRTAPASGPAPGAVVVFAGGAVLGSAGLPAPTVGVGDWLIAVVPRQDLEAAQVWLQAGAVDDLLVLPADEAAVVARLAVAAAAVDGSRRRDWGDVRALRVLELELAAAATPEEVARMALDGLSRTIGFDHGSIQLLDFEADAATVLAGSGPGGPVGTGETVDLTTFGVGFELLQGRPMTAVELTAGDSGDRLASCLAAAGYGSYLHLPLLARGSLIGSLLLASRDPAGLGAGRTAFAEALGVALGLALHDSNLLATVERLAVVDTLTGLLTRRQLFEVGRYEVQRARRYQRQLAAAMVDVDHFKRVNDRWGHRVGDLVLTEVAGRCRTGLRDVDLVGRYGGEEFAVLLPETDLVGGGLVAERIRETLASRPVEAAGHRLEITVSLGVTVLGAADGSLEALLSRADRALYDAKQGGRNRVVSLAP